MNEILSILNNKYIYDTGIYKDGDFIFFEKVLTENMSVKLKITKQELKNLIRKIEQRNISHTLIKSNKYFSVYELTQGNFIVIEFVVKSHIQLPKVILKDFMDDDKKLYYLDTLTNDIKTESVSKFNTELGYFALWFEEYLSNEYETIIGNVKVELSKFVNLKLDYLDLTKYAPKIKGSFSMAWYRNPNLVEEVNKKSLTSDLIYGGYKTEDLVYIMTKIGKFDYFKKFTPIICVNITEIGLVTCKLNFSEIKIGGGNVSLIMPLTPYLAIILIDEQYSKKIIEEHGVGCYMRLATEKQVKEINKYTYSYAKKVKGEAIIGKKKDLVILKGIMTDKVHVKN